MLQDQGSCWFGGAGSAQQLPARESVNPLTRAELQASLLGEAIFMGYEFYQQSILFAEEEERREIPSGAADSVE